MQIEWEKYHRFMPISGWCGPTTLWVIFSACGIKKPLWYIALHIYKWWYGSPYILLVAFLNKYFSLVNYKTGATIADISKHLKLGHICIINFQSSGDGHYAIVAEYKNKQVTIIDTSRDGNWKYNMSANELKRVWYDTLVNDNSLWHENLLIWVDPNSKR
jgi:hypothetical protein